MGGHFPSTDLIDILHTGEQCKNVYCRREDKLSVIIEKDSSLEGCLTDVAGTEFLKN